jgi:predicted Fe-S protein YdhL (DUF1289 family)
MEWLAKLAMQAKGKERDVPSPCISVCTMELGRGLCRGCLRTLDEIADWSTMSDPDKRAVWARIEVRATEQGARL